MDEAGKLFFFEVFFLFSKNVIKSTTAAIVTSIKDDLLYIFKQFKWNVPSKSSNCISNNYIVFQTGCYLMLISKSMALISCQIAHSSKVLMPWSIIFDFSTSCTFTELYNSIKNGQPSRKIMTNAPFQLLSVDPRLRTIQWLCHATWLRQLLLLEGTFHLNCLIPVVSDICWCGIFS
jgi:hypothetical protein